MFNDDREPISAQVTGLRDGEEVALLVSTADGQAIDDRIVMTRVDDANHYRCELPPGSGGFQQDTFYRITAGDATTQQYKLEVQIAPTIIVDRIDYHFPPYTGQADRTIKNQGDIKALEGTQVTIHATANMDIQEARIDLNCDGLQTLPMTTNGTKATGQFTLALDPDKAGKAQYDQLSDSVHRRPTATTSAGRSAITSTSIATCRRTSRLSSRSKEEVEVAGGWSTADPRTRLRSRLRLAARDAPGRTRSQVGAKRRNWACRCSWTAPSRTRPGRNLSTASISSGRPN